MKADTFGALKADIATVRARIDRLIWGTALGFAATIAVSAAFRYVG